MKLSETRKRYLKLIIILFIIYFFFSPIKMALLSAVGYPTAYEGAKARFYGVYDVKSGKAYTQADPDGASVARFDINMNFDPDDPMYYMCNLRGEMTSIQIPLGESKWVPPSWVPTSWWTPFLEVKNPVNVYEWEVEKDGEVIKYRMEEWVTVWYVSVSAEFDSGPSYFVGIEETDNQRYHDWEIWIEFDIQPVWYFKGADQTYFAIAKVELYDIRLEAKDSSGNIVKPREGVSVIPMSPGTPLYLYYEPFGGSEAADEEQLTSYYYRGVELNPQFFRDKVYAHIDLGDFGTKEWGWAWDRRAKGDVVTMAFKVRQFVVGEWRVKDIQEVEEWEGRPAKVGGGNPIIIWLNDFTSSPLGQIMGFATLFLLILAILAFSGVLGDLGTILFAWWLTRGGEEKG